MTGHAQNVTANVANLATVVSAAAANPLVKVASFGYGVRRPPPPAGGPRASARSATPSSSSAAPPSAGSAEPARRRSGRIGHEASAVAGCRSGRRCTGGAQAHPYRAGIHSGGHRHVADRVRRFAGGVAARLRGGRPRSAWPSGRRRSTRRSPMVWRSTTSSPSCGRTRASVTETSFRRNISDEDGGDQAAVPRPFRGERPHGGAVRSAARHQRPEPAVHQRRHGAVRPLLPGAADPAVPARDQRAEVHPHAGHRRGRQDQPARHVLPDERQLLLR